jgi:hypothetical protein
MGVKQELHIITKQAVDDRETSRLLHFLDSMLKNGGEVVTLTRRSPFTPQEDSWYLVLLEAEGLDQLEKPMPS